MKVKDEDSGKIENVTFIKDGEIINVMVGDKEMCSHHFLLMNYEIVDLAREEYKDFHTFLDDARFILYNTIDYFEGKVDGWREKEDEQKEKEKEDKKKNKKKKEDQNGGN